MKKQLRDCPECGAKAAVACSEKWRNFSWGEVEYSARIPIWTCRLCNSGYIDGRGMEIKHEFLCWHLGVLAPREIRELRERHGLSRAELEQLTGFGEASIKRWETGALIQNKSADRFLRLIDDADVLEKLRQLD